MNTQAPKKTSKAERADSLHRQLDRITREFKIVRLNENFTEDALKSCLYFGDYADYWRNYISKSPSFNPEVESLYVLLLNARLLPKGHHLVAHGTLDTILCHPREVFRAAVIGAASQIVVFHNHPSGDPSPSNNDITVTRDLIRAGQILKIEVRDHIIMGRKTESHDDFCSLREKGYFFDSTPAPMTSQKKSRNRKKSKARQ